MAARNLDLVLSVKDKNASSTVKALSSQVKGLTKAIAAVTAGISAVAGIKFTANAFQEARKLEEQMKVIQGLTGQTNTEFAKFERQTRQVARGIGSITALDFAKIEKTGVIMGVATNQLIEFSESIGYGSIALSSFQRNTELLSTHLAKQMKIFSLGAKDINAMMSAMAFLETNTEATALQISEFNQQLAAHARLMGLSHAEASTWGATIIATGMEASKAARQVRSAYNVFLQHMSADKNNSLLAAVRVISSAVDGGAKSIEILEQITGRTIKQMGGLQNAIQEALGISASKTFNAINYSLGSMTNKVEQGQEALKLYGAVGGNSMQILALESETLQEQIDITSQKFNEATHIQKVYNIIAESNSETLKVFSSILNDISLQIGGPILSAFARFTKEALIPLSTELSDWLQTSAKIKTMFDGLVDSAENLGKAIYAIIHIKDELNEVFFLFRQMRFMGESISQIFRQIQHEGAFAFLPFRKQLFTLAITISEVFEELWQQAKRVSWIFQPLVIAINAVTAAIDMIAEIGWRKSVFPEFILWAFRSLKSIDLLTRRVAWFDRNLKHAAGVLGTLVKWIAKAGAGTVIFFALRETIEKISGELNKIIGIDIYAQFATLGQNIEHTWQPSVLSNIFNSIKRWFTQWLDSLVRVAEGTLFESFAIGLRKMAYDVYNVFSSLPVSVPEKILFGWKVVFSYLMDQILILDNLAKDSTFGPIITTVMEIARFQVETLGIYVEAFATIWQEVWQGNFVGAAETALEAIGSLVEFAIQQWLILLWSFFPKIKAPLFELTGAIHELITTLGLEFAQLLRFDQPTFGGLVASFETVLTMVTNIATSMITQITEGISALYSLIEAVFLFNVPGIFHHASALITAIWNAMIEAITGSTKALFPSLSAYISEFAQILSGQFTPAIDKLVSEFALSISVFQQSFELHEVVRAMKAFFQAFTENLNLDPLFNAIQNSSQFLAELFTRLAISTQSFSLNGQLLANILNIIFKGVENVTIALLKLVGPITAVIKAIQFLFRTIITGWGRIFQFISPTVWKEILKYGIETALDMARTFKQEMEYISITANGKVDAIWRTIGAIGKALKRGRYFIEFFFLDVVMPFLDVLTLLTGTGGILSVIRTAGTSLNKANLGQSLKKLFTVFYDADGVAKSFRQTGDDIVETVRNVNGNLVTLTERTRTSIDTGFDKLRLGFKGTKEEITTQLTSLKPEVREALEGMLGTEFTDDLSRFGREFEQQYRKVGDRVFEFIKSVDSSSSRIKKFQENLKNNLVGVFPSRKQFRKYQDDVTQVMQSLDGDFSPRNIFNQLDKLTPKLRNYFENALGSEDEVALRLQKVAIAAQKSFTESFDVVNISGSITEQLTKGFDEFTRYTKTTGWQTFFGRLQISLEAIPDVLKAVVEVSGALGRKLFPRLSFFQTLGGDSQLKEAAETLTTKWEAFGAGLRNIPSPLEFPWKILKGIVKGMRSLLDNFIKFLHNLVELDFYQAMQGLEDNIIKFFIKTIPRIWNKIKNAVFFPFKKAAELIDEGVIIIRKTLGKVALSELGPGFKRLAADLDNFLLNYRLHLRVFNSQVRKWGDELRELLNISAALEFYGGGVQNIFDRVALSISVHNEDWAAGFAAIPETVGKVFAGLWDILMRTLGILTLHPDTWITELGYDIETIGEDFDNFIQGYKDFSKELNDITFWEALETSWEGVKSSIQYVIGKVETLYDKLIGHSLLPEWIDWNELVISSIKKIGSAFSFILKGYQQLYLFLYSTPLGERFLPDPEKLKALPEKFKGFMGSLFDQEGAGDNQLLGTFQEAYNGVIENISKKKNLATIMVNQFKTGQFREGIKSALTLAFDFATGKIQLGASLLDNIIPGFKQNFDQIKDILGDTLNSLFDNLTSIDLGMLFESGVSGLSTLQIAIAQLAAELVPLAQYLNNIILSLSSGDFVGGITSIGELLSHALASSGDFFAKLLEQWFPGTSQSIKKIFGGFGKIFEHLATIFNGIVATLRRHFAPLLEQIAEAVDKFAWGDLEGAVAAAWNAVKIAGLASVEAISASIKDLAPELAASLNTEHLFDEDLTLIEKLSDIIVAGVESAGPRSLAAFEEWLNNDVWITLFQDIGNVILWVYDKILMIVDGWKNIYLLIRYLPAALVEVWEWIKRIPLEFKNAWTELKHTHGWIDKIKGVFALLTRPIGALTEGLSFLLNNIVMPLVTLISTLFTLGGSGIFTGLGHTLVGLGKTLGKFVILFAKQKFIALITNFEEVLSELGGSLIQALVEPFTEGIEAIKGKWNDFKNFVGLGKKDSADVSGPLIPTGKTTVAELNNLKDQMESLTTLSDKAKQSYRETFNEMKVAIGNNITPTKELRNQFQKVVEDLNLVADTSHVHSTWPDMGRSILEVYPKLKRLQDGFYETYQSLTKLREGTGKYIDGVFAGAKMANINTTGWTEFTERYAASLIAAGESIDSITTKEKHRIASVESAQKRIKEYEASQSGVAASVKEWNASLKSNARLINAVGLTGRDLNITLRELEGAFFKQSITDETFERMKLKIQDGADAAKVYQEEIAILGEQFESYTNLVLENEQKLNQAIQNRIDKLNAQNFGPRPVVTAETLANPAYEGDSAYGYDITNRNQAVDAVKAIAHEIDNIDFSTGREYVVQYLDMVETHITKLRDSSNKNREEIRADYELAFDMEKEIIASRELLLQHDQEVFKNHVDAQRQWIDQITDDTKKWLFEQNNMEYAMRKAGIETNEYTITALDAAKAEYEAEKAIQKKVDALNKLAPQTAKATKEINKMADSSIEASHAVNNVTTAIAENAIQMVQIIQTSASNVVDMADFINETKNKLNETADQSEQVAKGVGKETQQRIQEELQLFQQLSDETKDWLIQQTNVEQALKRAGIAYSQYTIAAFEQFKQNRLETNSLTQRKNALDSLIKSTENAAETSKKISIDSPEIEDPSIRTKTIVHKAAGETIVRSSPEEQGIRRQSIARTGDLTSAMGSLESTIRQLISSLGSRGNSLIAQRYHSGGLASDEIPAILQTGEYVLSRRHISQIGQNPFLLDWLKAYGIKFHSGGPVRFHDGGGVPHSHEEASIPIITLDPKAGKGIKEAVEQVKELSFYKEKISATPIFEIDKENGKLAEDAIKAAREYGQTVRANSAYTDEAMNAQTRTIELLQRANHEAKTGEQVTEQSLLAIGHRSSTAVNSYTNMTDQAVKAGNEVVKTQTNLSRTTRSMKTAAQEALPTLQEIHKAATSANQTYQAVGIARQFENKLDYLEYWAAEKRNRAVSADFSSDQAMMQIRQASDYQAQVDALKGLEMRNTDNMSEQTRTILDQKKALLESLDGLNYMTDTKVVGQLRELNALLKESQLANRKAAVDQRQTVIAGMKTAQGETRGVSLGSPGGQRALIDEIKTQGKIARMGAPQNTVTINVEGRDKTDQQLAGLIENKVEGALNNVARKIQSRSIL